MRKACWLRGWPKNREIRIQVLRKHSGKIWLRRAAWTAVFSELTFTFDIIVGPSVSCLSVVCNVRARPTQAIEIFGNVFTPRGTLAILDLCIKNFTEMVSVGGVRGVAEYSDFWHIERYISETVQDKFVLITNRKSHMSFRLVPNSVTLDDLERRNSPSRSVISPNSVAFGTDCVKVVEDTPILFAAEM